MTQNPRRVQDALAQSEVGSALLHRYSASQRAAAAIESECQRIVPEFQPTRSGGCELRGTVLRVNAAQPAQVAKLRQAVPRLLRLLQQQGIDVIEIKIGVQPRSLTSSERRQSSLAPAGAREGSALDLRSTQRIVSALDFARKLALTLPDSSVGAAARRLAADLALRLARIRESGELGNQQDRKEKDA